MPIILEAVRLRDEIRTAGHPSVHIMLEAATGGPLRHNTGRRTTGEQRSVGILGYTVKVH